MVGIGSDDGRDINKGIFKNDYIYNAIHPQGNINFRMSDSIVCIRCLKHKWALVLHDSADQLTFNSLQTAITSQPVQSHQGSCLHSSLFSRLKLSSSFEMLPQQT